MVSRVVNLTLRGIQFLFTLLIMAIVGNMIDVAIAGNPSVVNYGIFLSLFAMLSLFYLIPAAFKEKWMMHPIFPLALDAANVLFWFCGAVAFAAELGVHSCSNSAYTRSNSITNGAVNTGARCRSAQAVTAFLWFGFVAWVITLVISFLGARGGGVNLRGSRKGAPQMSQV